MHEDAIIIDQLMTLKYLLDEIYLRNPSDYIYAERLANYIELHTGRKYKDQEFYSKIFAPMRDEGVIIAGSNRGLKIPLTVKELYDFASHTLSNILPRLDRLESVREKFLSLTNHELDILKEDKYKRIKDYMDKSPT